MNGTAQYQNVDVPLADQSSGEASQTPVQTRRTGVWIALSIVALAIVAAIVVNHLRAKAAAAKAPAPERVVPVTASVVKRRDIPIILEGLGTVTPLKTVTVHTIINGPLMAVYFKEGDDVKTGQPLALVDPRPYEVQLHQGEAQLAKDEAAVRDADITLDRDKTLLAQKLAPQQMVDDQQAVADEDRAAVQNDKATIESAKLNLVYVHINSPIDGTAGIRQVDPGNLVTTIDPNGIVILTQMDPTTVVFTLSQDELPRLQAAMAKGTLVVEVFTRDGLTSLGKGTLSFIDNQVNTQTAMLRLRAEIPNPRRLLWPQQFVKARLELQTEKDVIAVHSNVVQEGPNNTTFAYVVKPDNTVEIRDVKVASIAGDRSIISSGLNVGDTVVEDGQFQLKPGAKVVVKPAAGSKAAAADTGAPSGKGAEPGKEAPSGQGAPSGAP